MIRLRGGSGLGDSLYLRPITEWYQADGQPLTVMTDFPDVFRGTDAIVEPFNRNRINVLAHYANAKTNPATNQWQDIIRSAGLDIPLRFTWDTVSDTYVRRKRWAGNRRPMILVIGGREPMGRDDGFGRELLPRAGAFKAALDELDDCYRIRIGKGRQAYEVQCDLDLTNDTSVEQLMDLAKECDGIVGQCSYAIPLAEGFDKPLLIVWAYAGLCSRVPYISQITPAKILSKETSLHVVDNYESQDSAGQWEWQNTIARFRSMIGCVTNIEMIE